MVHFQALNIWLYDYMFYCDKNVVLWDLQTIEFCCYLHFSTNY